MYAKYAYKKYEDKTLLDAFNKDYIEFLSSCKNERLVVKYAVKKLEENGFKKLSEVEHLKKGDKVYEINKKKNVVAHFLLVDRLYHNLDFPYKA